jgi:hypothetical protein
MQFTHNGCHRGSIPLSLIASYEALNFAIKKRRLKHEIIMKNNEIKMQ